MLLKSAHLALGLAAPELFQLPLLLLQTRLKRLCLFHAAEQNLLLLSISLQQLLYLRLQALHKFRISAYAHKVPALAFVTRHGLAAFHADAHLGRVCLLSAELTLLSGLLISPAGLRHAARGPLPAS